MWWTKANDERSAIAERNHTFYLSTKWRKLRLHILAQSPLCDDCLAERDGRPVPAEDIHHVHPISTTEGWMLRLSMYDYSGNINLIPKCKKHHSRLTQMEQQAKDGKPVVSVYDRMNELDKF